LEKSRTNTLLHSSDFSSTWDGSTFGTLTLNATTSPDGTTNAALFQSDGASTSFLGSGLFQTYVSISATTTVTHSVFVKDLDAGSVRIAGGSLNNRFFNGFFDFGTEEFTITGSSLGEDVFTNVEKHNNAWYRISITCTPGYANNRFAILPNPGVGNTESVYVWGAQLEEDTFPFPTSYIPTTTATVTRAADISSSSTVTRAADVAQITGTNFSSWYNTSQSTWYAEGDQLKINANGNQEGVKSLFVDRYANISTQRWRENAWRGQQGSGTVIPVFTTPVTPAGSKVKTAYAIDGVNAKMCVEGVLSSDGTLGAYLGTTELRIGESARLIVNDKWSGHISRLTYWPKRLSDSDLQRLTE